MTMHSAFHAEPPTATESGRIIVGYDGSAGSSLAVDWAALEAAARGWPLCIASSAAAAHMVPHAQLQIAERLQDHLGISVSVSERAPSESLIDGVKGTDLFVLGPCPPTSRVPSLRRTLPSTASRRSPCPVVMVRGSIPPRIRRIVLGVDGSSAAKAATEWACSEAALHGAELLVVHVGEPDSAPSIGDVIVEEATDRCRQRIGAAALDLSLAGSPRSVLLALTRERDLVVVGSRGRSGFKTAAFGSVATGLAEYAHCPVVITQPRPKESREERRSGSDTV
jgi:nucleotide-binding universal stress UspA family protein